MDFAQLFVLLQTAMKVLSSEQFQVFLKWLLSLNKDQAEVYLSKYNPEHGGFGCSCDEENCPHPPAEVKQCEDAILATLAA